MCKGQLLKKTYIKRDKSQFDLYNVKTKLYTKCQVNIKKGRLRKVLKWSGRTPIGLMDIQTDEWTDSKEKCSNPPPLLVTSRGLKNSGCPFSEIHCIYEILCPLWPGGGG